MLRRRTADDEHAADAAPGERGGRDGGGAAIVRAAAELAVGLRDLDLHAAVVRGNGAAAFADAQDVAREDVAGARELFGDKAGLAGAGEAVALERDAALVEGLFGVEALRAEKVVYLDRTALRRHCNPACEASARV